MNLKSKNTHFRKFFVLIFFPILFNQINIYAEVIKNNDLQDNVDIQKDLYLLGPGDNLNIKILNDEKLSTNARILSDGSISLPLVDPVNVNGLTIKQATNEISRVMAKEIIQPLVQITINKSRPVSVSVLGELKRPGIYLLDQDTGISNNTSYIFPRLTDAIEQAGGITPNSNLNEIIIARKLPDLENTEYKMTTVNLLELISSGKQENNPYLFDGDIVKIKRTEKRNKDFIRISKANFIDQSIEVNVIGEVVNPSAIKLPSNSSLIQGIFKAGGLKNTRASKSNIELIRLDKDRGTISKEYYSLDLRNGLKQKSNPVLLDNDVVIVKRSSLAKVSDSLNAISKPISSTLQIYTLLRLLD